MRSESGTWLQNAALQWQTPQSDIYILFGNPQSKLWNPGSWFWKLQCHLWNPRFYLWNIRFRLPNITISILDPRCCRCGIGNMWIQVRISLFNWNTRFTLEHFKIFESGCGIRESFFCNSQLRFGIPHILIENPQSPFVTLSSWGTRCIVWELHNYYIHINIWSSFATHDPVSWVYIVVRNLQFQVWNIGTRVWDTRFQFATLGYLPIRTYTRSTEGIHQDPTRKPQAIVPVGMFESNIVNPDICAERWGYSRGSHGELTGNRARWHGWK